VIRHVASSGAGDGDGSGSAWKQTGAQLVVQTPPKLPHAADVAAQSHECVAIK
jgi:hypothetical protein